MTEINHDLLRTLKEIRALLEPISVCFEDRAEDVRLQRLEENQRRFEAMLTPIRRRIYTSLFDPRHLSQVEIAEEVHTSQPTVSRFVNSLLQENFVGQTEDEDGRIVLVDKYKLLDIVKHRNGEG